MKFVLIITNLAIILRCVHMQTIRKNEEIIDDEEFYRKLFMFKRSDHLDAIKSLKMLVNVEKQQSMINLMTEKIFEVMQDSRAFIESSGYIPGISDFPSDEKIKDALSNILENTALYCELVLRFPDTATKILQKNNNWNVMLQWSIGFCDHVNHLLGKSTVKLLHLASQELNYIEREADYINPYRDNASEEVQPSADVKIPRKKKVKKKIKRGPKLVDFHSEL